MVKELKSQLNKTFSELDAKWGTRETGNMPITKNQVLTFIAGADGVETRVADINGNKTTYGVFLTKEGFSVPFSQIARKGNGLNLKKATRKEAIEEFAERIDGNYSVRVADVKKVESSFGEGKLTYYLFETV